MQQNCISINTSKTVEEMENTVKQLGMEIIFKSKYASIYVDELSDQERKAWINSLEMELDRLLESTPMFSKTLEMLIEKGRKYADEVRSFLKQYSENPTRETLESIHAMYVKTSDELRNAWKFYDRPYRMLQYVTYPTFNVSPYVSVSCLIAKKGENMVRYIGILQNKDPIVTIMGPDAETLKISLEANLG